MNPTSQDRAVFLHDDGPRCVNGRDLVEIPAEFLGAASALGRDLRVALDCYLAFGAVPRAIAKAVLHNMDAAQTGFDMALKGETHDSGKDAN